MRGTVVVTGASSGIGAETVRVLVGEGFQVFGTHRRPEDAASIQAAGATALRMDVTEDDQVIEAAREVDRLREGVPLAGLVNNAGIPGAGPLELLPVEEFRKVIDVNLLGVLRVTRAFLPALREARGRIVMMGSVSGRVAMPFAGPYAASKYALEGLSDSLRRELLPTGVDVILLQPGSVDTPIWDRVEALDISGFDGTPYETGVRRVRSAALRGGRTGLSPGKVAEEVARALTAPRPPARRLIVSPGSAFWLRVLQLLPDRWADRLIARRAWR